MNKVSQPGALCDVGKLKGVLWRRAVRRQCVLRALLPRAASRCRDEPNQQEHKRFGRRSHRTRLIGVTWMPGAAMIQEAIDMYDDAGASSTNHDDDDPQTVQSGCQKNAGQPLMVPYVSSWPVGDPSQFFTFSAPCNRRYSVSSLLLHQHDPAAYNKLLSRGAIDVDTVGVEKIDTIRAQLAPCHP